MRTVAWMAAAAAVWATAGCGGSESSDGAVALPGADRETEITADADLTSGDLATRGRTLADLVAFVGTTARRLAVPAMATEVGICGASGSMASDVMDSNGNAKSDGRAVAAGDRIVMSFVNCTGAPYEADGVVEHVVLALDPPEEETGPAAPYHLSTHIDQIGSQLAGTATGAAEAWARGSEGWLVRLYEVNWSLGGTAAVLDLDLRCATDPCNAESPVTVVGGVALDRVVFGVRTEDGLAETHNGETFVADLTSGSVALVDAEGDRVLLRITGANTYELAFWPSGAASPSEILPAQVWPAE